MARRSRRPARPPDGSAPVLPLQPTGLVLREVPTMATRVVDVVLKHSRRIIRVKVPFVRFPLASDETVGPLVLTIHTQDRKAWMEMIAQDPTSVGTLFLEQLILTDSPRPRGRHARRTVFGHTLRIHATAIYLTLEQWAKHDVREYLEALKKHARQRDDDSWGHMKQRGQWHLSLLTAYVMEQEFPQAFTAETRPTSDPKTFYANYIRDRRLQILRSHDTSRFSRAHAILFRLIRQAQSPPRS
jgi:hypothetical protein